MRTMSRRTVLAAGAAMMSAAVSGCGTGVSSSDSKDLNVWGGVPAENGPQAMCDAFMKDNPGTTVTYTRFINDEKGNVKLDTALSGGANIDVIWTYTPGLLEKRAKAGTVIDLSEYLNKANELAAFRGDAKPVSNYMMDGKVFSIPCSATPPIVLVNATLLDEAGIELPTSWTWEEYRDVARKLSGQNRFGLVAAPDTAGQTLGPNANYTPAGECNFGNAAFITDLERAQQMQTERSLMPLKTVLAEKLRVYMQAPFVQQRVAMLQGSVLYITRYLNDTKEYPHDFKVACLPFPHAAITDPWEPRSFSDLASITSKSKNPALAFEFIRYYVLNAAKLIPGRPPTLLGDTSVDELIAKTLGPDMDKLYLPETFKTVLYGPQSPKPAVDSVFTAAEQLRTIKEKLSDEVMLGTRTIASWTSEAVKQGNAAIAAVK